MPKVKVYYSFYGCDTGCTGHRVELEDGTSKFFFSFPEEQDPLSKRPFPISGHMISTFPE